MEQNCSKPPAPLEFYGIIKTKSSLEGKGYYVMDYESISNLSPDPELMEAFKLARQNMYEFYDLLDARIKAYGKDPDDFTA